MVAVQTESVKFADIAASEQFALEGGVYLLAVTLAAGTVDLQVELPDGIFTTVNQNGTPVHFAANGTSGPLFLPPGSYQLLLTGANGVNASLSAVPRTQIH